MFWVLKYSNYLKDAKKFKTSKFSLFVSGSWTTSKHSTFHWYLCSNLGHLISWTDHENIRSNKCSHSKIWTLESSSLSYWFICFLFSSCSPFTLIKSSGIRQNYTNSIELLLALGAQWRWNSFACSKWVCHNCKSHNYSIKGHDYTEGTVSKWNRWPRNKKMLSPLEYIITKTIWNARMNM